MSGEWPKLICLACGHTIHPEDEGACDCGFVPGQEPKHVAVVPAERFDEAVAALEAAEEFIERVAQWAGDPGEIFQVREQILAAIQAAKGSEG